MGNDVFEITINSVKLIVVFLFMVQAVPVLVWLERRGSAFIQNRFGPNRVGPLGLLQLLADAVKFLFKEEFMPAKGIRFLYYAAPVVALVPASQSMLNPFPQPNQSGAAFKAEVKLFRQSKRSDNFTKLLKAGVMIRA